MNPLEDMLEHELPPKTRAEFEEKIRTNPHFYYVARAIAKGEVGPIEGLAALAIAILDSKRIEESIEKQMQHMGKAFAKLENETIYKALAKSTPESVAESVAELPGDTSPK